MATDRAIYVPLFTETSLAVDSPFFTVMPGEIAILQAFGFADVRHKEDPTELTVPQVACLEMLIFKEGVVPSRQVGTCSVMELSQFQAQLLARETMRRNGCMFSLSKCNNIMLLNIPGSYQLVMNDATAVGDARVYLRVATYDKFPWSSKFLIGE